MSLSVISSVEIIVKTLCVTLLSSDAPHDKPTNQPSKQANNDAILCHLIPYFLNWWLLCWKLPWHFDKHNWNWWRYFNAVHAEQMILNCLLLASIRAFSFNFAFFYILIQLKEYFPSIFSFQIRAIEISATKLKHFQLNELSLFGLN